ncbi:MAG: hypothetical protein DHS20C18_45190 [Saprospiraceae bacterium]|nr:MAG: hypothetical protein DHS20C18_45190 [Saprospiraceae bacterium]
MKHILTVCLVLMSVSLIAQKSAELGILLGASTYDGDLSPENSAFDIDQYRPAFAFFYRYNANRFLGIKASFAYGEITADDAHSNIEAKQQRNLNFHSNILELGLTGELNLLGFAPGRAGSRFSPYLFGGVSFFRFNPRTEYQGQTVDLQPLGTEGQGIDGFDDPYSLTQIAIPFGGGIKYAITDRINIGLEVGFRKTFTDYLDDVSGVYVDYNTLSTNNGKLAADLSNRTGEFFGTEPVDVPGGTPRGNPNKDDWFFIGGFTLSYTIFSQSQNGLSGHGGKYKGQGKGFGCPKF